MVTVLWEAQPVTILASYHEDNLRIKGIESTQLALSKSQASQLTIHTNYGPHSKLKPPPLQNLHGVPSKQD